MSDLIDREVARTIICEKCENYSTVSQRCKLTDCGGWCRVFSLYSVPTVDAKPVRHGRWIKQENGLNLCSACGVTKVSHLPFCGHCGADMREGGAENG